MANINKLCNGRNDAVKFVDDYGSMILEAKRKSAVDDPATNSEKATKPAKASKKSKTKRKISSLKLRYEKNINEQIVRDYFLFQTPSYKCFIR